MYDGHIARHRNHFNGCDWGTLRYNPPVGGSLDDRAFGYITGPGGRKRPAGIVDRWHKIREAHLRASLSVNVELVTLHWRIGWDILERQLRLGWGAKIVDKLALNLRSEFRGVQGFSRANLLYMRAFAEAWPDPQIVQRVVGRLRCLIAVDLKIGAFRPEHAGKMNFYLAALDDRERKPSDSPSIGLILCHERNGVVVEYALQSVSSPIGVAEYKLRVGGI